MEITYDQLGRPKASGYCNVPGVGNVQITDRELTAWEEVGYRGRCRLMLVSSADAKVPEFRLGPIDVD